MNDQIAPFAELLGKVPDERIAEMAGVDVADVQAAREPAPAKATKGKKPAKAKAPAPAAEPAPAPPPAKVESPPTVLRVKVGLRIPDGHGGDRFVPRSIYRGDVAARLWNDPQVPREALEVLER